MSKTGGNVVTYFCTPDLHVLGWVVGPVSAENLLTEAKLALESAYAVRRVENLDIENQRQQVREHYLSQMHAINRRRISLWSYFDKKTDRSDVAESVAGIFSWARKANANTMAQFSAEWSRQAKIGGSRNPEFRAAATRIQNRITADLSRMVISELPFIKLEHLQRLVFESLANQKFEPRSDRNEDLLNAVNDSISRERPMLLVIDEDLETRSDNAALTDMLKSFTVLKLSLKELTRLSDDLNHSPVETSRGSIRIVVLDSQGSRTGVITSISRATSTTQRYRSVLRDPTGTPQRNLDSLLISELKLVAAAE